jgi:hypothetical protein
MRRLRHGLVAPEDVESGKEELPQFGRRFARPTDDCDDRTMVLPARCLTDVSCRAIRRIRRKRLMEAAGIKER